MVSWMIIGAILLFIGFFIGLIVWKPGLVKKDLTKPLTLGNLSLKKVFVGDWKSFLIWIFIMFMAWSYFHDTAECRALIENFPQECSEWYEGDGRLGYYDQLLNLEQYNYTTTGIPRSEEGVYSRNTDQPGSTYNVSING